MDQNRAGMVPIFISCSKLPDLQVFDKRKYQCRFADRSEP